VLNQGVRVKRGCCDVLTPEYVFPRRLIIYKWKGTDLDVRIFSWYWFNQRLWVLYERR
jgi:hypothetical protein